MHAVTHASPLPYPLAEASSVLQRPSGASMLATARLRMIRGQSKSRTPLAVAPATLRLRTPKTAASMATRDDEHAVLIVRLGPFKANMYATRPDAMLLLVAVALKAVRLPAAWTCRTELYSMSPRPT
eukprot:scaffold120720_cov51-Prasinocladus_malaysianus.AAC.2